MLTVDDTLKEMNRKLIRCWHIIQFIFFLYVLVEMFAITNYSCYKTDKPRLITMFQLSLKLFEEHTCRCGGDFIKEKFGIKYHKNCSLIISQEVIRRSQRLCHIQQFFVSVASSVCML